MGTWSAPTLEPFRARTDPPADAVLDALERDGGVLAVHDLLATMERWSPVPWDRLPVAARRFLDDASALPRWIEPRLLRVAEGLVLRCGHTTVAAVACASLPMRYATPGAARVLAAGGVSERLAMRSVAEAVGFVVDVLHRGGLARDGAGVRASVELRLRHATLRRLLVTDPAALPTELRTPGTLGAAVASLPWNPAWGAPLNQADIALAVRSSSTGVLRAWERVGIATTDDDRAAWTHAWRVVGHLLGVEEALNPLDPVEAGTLADALFAAARGATPEGRALTAGLHAALASTLGAAPLSGPSVTWFLRRLLGAATADLLDVPTEPAAAGAMVTSVARARTALASLARPVEPRSAERQFAELLGARLLHRIARLDRGGERVLFHLPDALRTAWDR